MRITGLLTNTTPVPPQIESRPSTAPVGATPDMEIQVTTFAASGGKGHTPAQLGSVACFAAMDDRLRVVMRTVQTYFPGVSDARHALQRGIFGVLRRPFEGDFRAITTFELPADAVLLDIGANRGQSIDALRLVSPGRIVAFEPNVDLAEKLRKRYSRDSDITIHALALGAERGTFTLFVPVYNGFSFDGLASLDEREATEWLMTRILRFDSRKLNIHKLDCHTVRLDDLSLSPSFIKIDVQGTELQVLQGSLETLAQYRPVLLIENAELAIIDFLSRLGYRPYSWERGRLIPNRIGKLNTFFMVA